MSDRERWTVYPLLFLTLGVALKDKIVREVNVKDVICQKVFCNALVVTDPRGGEQVAISSNDEGGQVRVHGTKNRMHSWLGNTGHATGLMFIDVQGIVRPGSMLATTGSYESPSDSHAGGQGPPQGNSDKPAQ